MSSKTLLRALGVFLVVSLACGMLVAQDLKVSPRPAQVRFVGPPVAPSGAAATTFLFNNLGPTNTNLYNAPAGGYYVCGTNCPAILTDQWIGVQFFNKSASHAGQILAAIGWISGTKKVNLGIYTDSAGVPGTQLGGGSTTNIPTYGTCCGLAQVSFAGVALSANTNYWVVATADDVNASDFEGAWLPTNQANIAADVTQTGWFGFSGLVPAAAVKGTIP